jgi:hypothetical protein
MSPINTSILPVRKLDGSYWLVQAPGAIKQTVHSKHPVVPNPYTLLSRIPPDHQWFSVVHLKDAFWACPLAEDSRDIFAFGWEDPQSVRKQHRWTGLPQCFTDSPNLFGQILECVLEEFVLPPTPDKFITICG